MTEQDILNKIKESADSVEIPESLKPEQIELKLKEEKKPGKFKWQAMHLVAAAVVLVLMLGAMPIGLNLSSAGNDSSYAEDDVAGSREYGQQNATAPDITAAESGVEMSEGKQDAGELYQLARSEEEVCAYLKNYENAYTRYYGDDWAIPDSAVDGAVVEEAEAEDLASGAGSVKQEAVVTDTATNSVSHSITNLQMAGVDESDIVKTNGTHIFMVKDGVVQVVQIKDGDMTSVGTIAPETSSFSDRVLEMYVDNDKLILIVEQVKESLEGTSAGKNTGGYLPLTEDTREVCVDVAYNFDASYHTVLYTYDISNPAKARQIGKIEQDGFYRTSRKIDDMVYLFTNTSYPLEKEVLAGEDDNLLELLPKVNGESVSYDNIYLPEFGYEGLLVSSVSMDNPKDVVDNTLILNEFVEIYVSSSALYLYNADYRSDIVYTQIAKFSLKNGRISAVAAATVPGTVQDTFAINEYEDNLRVLTSHWNPEVSDNTNQLYILDKNLKAAGKIENIAEGETIYAARYFGDLAYFITYRNIDPLFAADLSDIHNPKILGELKITGYSEYLHMWGEDKLLGIGYETDADNGSRKGIKLVMFDISNPAELSIIDTVVIKNADYSPALFNYKAVLADTTTNMIGFVTADYSEEELAYQVYSFENGKFTKELAVEKDDIKHKESYRGLWAGDYFYLVNPAEIKSFNYKEDYKAVKEFSF